jgi:hypothetical protein
MSTVTAKTTAAELHAWTSPALAAARLVVLANAWRRAVDALDALEADKADALEYGDFSDYRAASRTWFAGVGLAGTAAARLLLEYVHADRPQAARVAATLIAHLDCALSPADLLAVVDELAPAAA